MAPPTSLYNVPSADLEFESYWLGFVMWWSNVTISGSLKSRCRVRIFNSLLMQYKNVTPSPPSPFEKIYIFTSFMNVNFDGLSIWKIVEAFPQMGFYFSYF